MCTCCTACWNASIGLYLICQKFADGGRTRVSFEMLPTSGKLKKIQQGTVLNASWLCMHPDCSCVPWTFCIGLLSIFRYKLVFNWMKLMGKTSYIERDIRLWKLFVWHLMDPGISNVMDPAISNIPGNSFRLKKKAWRASYWLSQG